MSAAGSKGVDARGKIKGIEPSKGGSRVMGEKIRAKMSAMLKQGQ